MTSSVLRQIDDEWGGFEASRTMSPHEHDVKCILVSQSVTNAILKGISRVWRNEAHHDWTLDLSMFSTEGPDGDKCVDYRVYPDSGSKRGLFIQAACLVTDGHAKSTHDKVLTIQRSPKQFYDRSQDRFTIGTSCLVSTPLMTVTVLDKFGHVPAIVFNDIKDSNPFAIFSRKLLVPDTYVESRFLGLGYNLKSENRKYLFLVWHVRTSQTPEVMLVDARRTQGAEEHDRLSWVGRERVPELQMPPVDAAALEALEHGHGAYGNRDVGFVGVERFERIHRADWTFTHVNRDEIILDLFRIIQRDFHSGRVGELPKGRRKEFAFQQLIERHLHVLAAKYGLRIRVLSQAKLGWGPGRGEPDLLIEVLLDRFHRSFTYIVEIKVDPDDSTPSEYLVQAQRYREATRTPESGIHHIGRVDAVLLVQGIWPSSQKIAKSISVVALEADITLPDPSLPIHVVRILVTPPSPSASRQRKEIVHAIVPIFSRGQCAGLLFHKGAHDPGFQPIGGKVEGFETHLNALSRELEEETEELGRNLILGSDIEDVESLVPGSGTRAPGLSLKMISPSSGRRTSYLFHPFLIRLTSQARRRLADSLGKVRATLRVVPLEEWAETRNELHSHRYDPAYAKAVIPYLTSERLKWAAVEVEDLPAEAIFRE